MWVSERPGPAVTNGGSALEIGTSDMDHRGDPQKNALFSEPVSQTVQHGPEREPVRLVLPSAGPEQGRSTFR